MSSMMKSLLILLILLTKSSFSYGWIKYIGNQLLHSETLASCGTEVIIDDTSCYSDNINNDLPYADGSLAFFGENSIFFIATSCKGGLDDREICSVESAARAHPHRQINVLFAGPVYKYCLLIEPMSALKKYKNVHLYRIYPNAYAEGTPLEKLFKSERFQTSRYPVHHVSDVLKFLTLYKYGGIYLDLDVLVMKSLDSLPQSKNWVGQEDYEGRHVSSALIAVSKNEIGRHFMKIILRLLRYNFNPYSWHYNGNGVIKAALWRICSTSAIWNMTADKCQGFTVYPTDYFFQLQSQYKRDQIFEAHRHHNILHSYALHMFASTTSNLKIDASSVYAKLMNKFCPQVHNIKFQSIANLKANFKKDSSNDHNVNNKRSPNTSNYTDTNRHSNITTEIQLKANVNLTSIKNNVKEESQKFISLKMNGAKLFIHDNFIKGMFEKNIHNTTVDITTEENVYYERVTTNKVNAKPLSVPRFIRFKRRPQRYNRNRFSHIVRSSTQ